MKIKLVVEKGNKIAEVKFTKSEIGALHDLLIIAQDEELPSDIKKEMPKLFKKFLHIVHDIIYDGVVYKFERKKLVRLKEKVYMVKKPKWKVK